MSHSSCRCNCNPCVCPSPGGLGCVQDACVPRPCYFQGQLIGAEDLNALTTYVRTKDALLARFVGGWGVAAGMRLRPAPGIRSRRLEPDVSRNPAVLAGTKVEIGMGLSIDALGRTLALCAPRVIDVAALAAEDPIAPETRSCAAWFGSAATFCPGGDVGGELTARAYYVVAEYEEHPTRPAPMLAGGGACDPAPSCDFSRTLEGVRISLVRSVPAPYELTGCLDAIDFDWTFPTGDDGDGGGGDSPEEREREANRTDALVDDLLEELVENCCSSRPAVVLGRILLTSDPSGINGGAGDLPDVPVYTIVDDARPLRRLVPSVALTWSAANREYLELEE